MRPETSKTQFAGFAWLVLLTLVLLLDAPPGNPWLWDLLNGLGFAALGLLGIVVWSAPATAAGYSARTLRLHIILSAVLIVAVLVHALGLLLSNAAVVEYLKWRAPLYMHAGNLALLLLLLLSVISTARVRLALHRSFHSFRNLHRLLSVLAMGLCLWHVLGSGYLARAGWQVTMLIGISAVLAALWLGYPERQRWPVDGARWAAPGWIMASAFCVLLVTGLYAVRLAY
ncbi:MAG: hypothetical protein ACR2PZ_26210 [Pseudomonadales bacterium]